MSTAAAMLNFHLSRHVSDVGRQIYRYTDIQIYQSDIPRKRIDLNEIHTKTFYSFITVIDLGKLQT